MSSRAAAHRPKFTRRRGACKECRMRKIRCNGATPCRGCERNFTACEYTQTRRSQRSQDSWADPSTSSHNNNTFHSTTLPVSPTDYMVTPSSLELFDFVYETPTEQRGNATTSNSGQDLLQVNSQKTPPYLDDMIFEESLLDTETGQASQSQQNILSSEIPHSNCRTNNDLAAFEDISSLSVHQNNELNPENFIGNNSDQYSFSLSLPSLQWKVLTQPSTTTVVSQVCDITAVLQLSNLCDATKNAALRRIKNLLSSSYQICLSSFWRDSSSGTERLPLTMSSPDIGALIQKAFQEPGGLDTLASVQQIIQIHRTAIDDHQGPVRLADLSLLLVTITWGALLDADFDKAIKAALVDAVEEVTNRLLEQTDTVDKFIALVSMLCLAEKMCLKKLHTLILACVGTASSLKLHLRSEIRASCGGNEHSAQVEQAMRILYCIEKSYALRWQTFPLLSRESLTTADTRKNPLLGKDTSVASLELMQARVEYAHICLHIAELRKVVDGTAPDSLLVKITGLATALDSWYKSITTNPIIVSLEEDAVRRIRHHAFCHYHEALLHLGSIYLSQQGLTDPLHQKLESIRQRSSQEVITSCNVILLNDLLQDQNLIFLSILAFCLLAQDILLNQNVGLRNENKALLSIACGFFARIRILYPETSIFEEASCLLAVVNNG